MPGGRLLLRPHAARCRAVGGNCQGLCSISRAVHRRIGALVARHGVVARACESARPRKDHVEPRARTVELAAKHRGLPLRWSGNASIPGPVALWRENQSCRRIRLRRGNRRRRSPQLRMEQCGLCHGGQHQPQLQALRLVHDDPRRGVGWHRRELAVPHLPDRRRRLRHEVSDRNRDLRPPRG
ncbi:hypothetical protein D3C85_1169770 [compost metagenome]